MKQLEKSAEKALEREEKLVEKIYSLQSKYKLTEAKFEYGEMNITKLNQRIDDIEDEIYGRSSRSRSPLMKWEIPSMTCSPTTKYLLFKIVIKMLLSLFRVNAVVRSIQHSLK